MARIVMKFGGTSVADIARIRNVARHVKREVDAGHEVAVVVSAMSGKTNELVGWVQGMPRATGANSPFFDAREYDAVVASGEQVTAGLLAIALQDMGVHARSWQGWQIPIRTDNSHGAARIQEIDGTELISRFGKGQVAVISGFRWSFFGISDVGVGISVGMTLAFLAICLTIVAWMFRTGYRLKS